jgi:hypothetical protein
MLIDFTPVRSRTVKLREFAAPFGPAELRAATQASIEAIAAIVREASDTEIAFIPIDPDAHDPHAVPGEETLGWSLGHLVAHVTASAEEGAAFGSLLARGVPLMDEALRLRYETPWPEIDTRAKALQRLEESRRIRLAYLETWPDRPHLDVYRPDSARKLRLFGPVNAPAAVLAGMMHEQGHLDQMRETLRQAREAGRSAYASAAAN